MSRVSRSFRFKVLFLVSEDWYFWSHRLGLARAAKASGCEVVVATRVHACGRGIESEGFKLYPINLRRGGMNPFADAWAVFELARLYARERPDIVHQVAAKPILCGTIAARLAGVRCIVNAFAGLGFLFIRTGWRAQLLRWLVLGAYRLAMPRRGMKAVFQNEEDAEIFVRSGVIPRNDAVLIRGAGVDESHFVPTPEPEGPPLVVMPSRMLWDKGVGEFVEAVRILRAKGVRARFCLVGDRDPENPASIHDERLVRWREEGVVEWRGRREDMPQLLSESAIICLPSYREGLPKSLLEASAAGRPIVATDVPGCRHVVRHEVNGLLVPPRDSAALAGALERLLRDKALRLRLGLNGRAIVVADFSEKLVVERTLELYRELACDAGISS